METKFLMKKIVLIEPICTGSRLLYLAKTIECLQGSYSVTVFTRSNYKTPLFDEVMKGLEYEIISVEVDLGGEQIRNLSFNEWMRYIFKLRLYDRGCREEYDLIFLALDDYFFSFVLARLYFRKLRNARRCFALKYRVGALLNPLASFRNLVLFFWTHLACLLWKMKLIVFDERLEGKKVGCHQLACIPDFWSGDFSENKHDEALQKYGYSGDDFVALVIGGQDERKGFDFLMEALPLAFTTLPKFKICVHGKVKSELLEPFLILCSDWPERIKYCPEFILEEQLPFPYAMAAVVLLPYHTSFSSTSGVLPRAVASGVPVIASDHGLIGERIRKYSLGEIFKYGDIGGFVTALNNVINSPRGLSLAGNEFAVSCSESAFKSRFIEVISK